MRPSQHLTDAVLASASETSKSASQASRFAPEASKSASEASKSASQASDTAESASSASKSLSKASIDNWPFCFVSGEADFYPKFGFQKLNLKDIVFNYPIDPDRLHIKYLNSKAKEILGNPPWVVKEYIKNNLFC